MKIGPPVKLYTVATPPADTKPQPFPLMSKQLFVKDVIPIVGDPSAISSAIASGKPLYVRRPFIGTGLIATQLKTASAPPQPVTQVPEQPPKANPPATAPGSAELPPIATMAPKIDDKQATVPPSRLREILMRGAAAPGLFEMSKGSFHVLELTRTTTHAELVGNLQTVGFSPPHAGSVATTILDFVHTRGFSSVLIGISIGGAVAALVGFFRPSTQIGTLATIIVTIALVVSLIFKFLVPASNPFVGEWQMSTADSKYAVGKVPGAAKTVISEDRKSLTINQNMVDPDGKSQELSYVVYPDGKDHPAEGVPGADTTVTTLSKKNLTTLFALKGRPVRTVERVLSSDQKKMTETVTFRQTDGKELKNVTVYEQK